ncbi:MAG TPA: hypothetical protein VEI29_02910, partial [Burkholderiaceae bacterium]|nr:hypothetical protein [Burkholderiaceae bacterium]
MIRTNSNVNLSGDRNKCLARGELFNSTAPFGRHRRGDFGKPVNRGGWRSLSANQMRAACMSNNRAGFRITNHRPENALRRLRGTASCDERGAVRGEFPLPGRTRGGALGVFTAGGTDRSELLITGDQYDPWLLLHALR